MMLIENIGMFNNYLIQEGYNANRIDVIKGVYKKLTSWEIKKNKSIKFATKEEILKLTQTGSTKITKRSYGSLQTRLEGVNKILQWINSDIRLSIRDYEVEDVLIDNKERYFTKEEIKDISDLFINPQDSFIVYGLFCGIFGKSYSDLINLKVDDINFNNRTITTPSGHIIHMDDYLFEIAQDVVDNFFGRIYYKYLITGDETNCLTEYEVNMDSPYVIKTKPYKRNNNGMNPLSLNGIQKRLKTLSDFLNEELNTNDLPIKLSGLDLYRSGIIDELRQEELVNNKEWTFATISERLKEKNINVQNYELFRIYKNKYRKE